MSNTRILVIDDEKGMRDILYKTFKAWKYLIEMAENAKQGIRKLKKNHFDFVLLDVVIPKEEFEDNFRKIRKCNPRIPVIVISALAPVLVKGLCDKNIREGISGMIYKPFKIKDLIFCIEKISEHNRQIKQEFDMAV